MRGAHTSWRGDLLIRADPPRPISRPDVHGASRVRTCSRWCGRRPCIGLVGGRFAPRGGARSGGHERTDGRAEGANGRRWQRRRRQWNVLYLMRGCNRRRLETSLRRRPLGTHEPPPPGERDRTREGGKEERRRQGRHAHQPWAHAYPPTRGEGRSSSMLPPLLVPARAVAVPCRGR